MADLVRPHTTDNFWVQIDGINVASFSEVTGLNVETEVYEYNEGGQNGFVHKLPGRVKYSNITLKRGINHSRDLYDWFVECASSTVKKRKNLSIVLYSEEKDKEIHRWDLHAAWPVKWTGPDLRSESAVATVESIEIAHHGLNLR